MKIELPPIVEFQTRIIHDFENTEFAGRESKLILDPEDFIFNINTEYFRDQLERRGFGNYAKQLFLRSLQKIAEDGHFVKKSGVDGWENFLNITNNRYFCVNERMSPKEFIECQIKIIPKTRP